MSGGEWRFTDGEGAERTVGTEELRASLASGKIAPSTLVWRDGMVEWQPAFTLPELSSAAIAAGRPKSIPPVAGRSAPPPLPARKPRQVARTLTGIEPPEVLAAMGLTPGQSADKRDLPPLGEDDEDWDSTDIIPKAPPLPRDVKLVAPRALSSAGTLAKGDKSDEGKRTTLLGFGSNSGRASRPPVGPVPRNPIRAPAPSPKTSEAPPTQSLGLRSKPPPPPTRPKSQAPPPPRRLTKTLEIEVSKEKGSVSDVRSDKKSVSPAPVRTGLRSKPPPAPPLKAKPMAPLIESPTSTSGPTHVGPLAPLAPSDPAPGSRETPPPAPDPNGSETSTELQAKARSPLQEKTDLLIPVISAPKLEAKAPEPSSESDAPPPRSRTLEMALDDHSVASQKDPAPPANEPAPAAPAKKKRVAAAVPAEERRQKLERETTDGTAARDAEASPSDRPRRTKPKNALEVPVRSVLGVSAAWVLGLIAFFFVGRVSGFKSAAKQPEAREGVSEAFLLQAPPPPAGEATSAKPKPIPCWSARRPTRYAASASKQVGFDMRAMNEAMFLGYAVDEKKAAALKIDPASGKFEEVFKKDTDKPVVRVSPLADGAFYVAEKADATFYPVQASAPFYLSFAKGSIGLTSAPDIAPKEIWSLSGEDPTVAEQVLAVGDQFLLSFRQGNTVMAGYFAADGSAKTPLFKVAGSEGKSGKPRAGTNGQQVAITFADKPSDDAPWQIRLGTGAPGAPIETAAVVELPKGGPGGDAIAPDLVGLSNGRWLLMWTEGSAGERAIQAQTYDASFTPIGDPIALSPPAGNFGQAMLSVVGTYTNVAFLQAADDGFELWGAVLQCDL